MLLCGNFLKQLIEPEIALEKIAPVAGLHPHFFQVAALPNHCFVLSRHCARCNLMLQVHLEDYSQVLASL